MARIAIGVCWLMMSTTLLAGTVGGQRQEKSDASRTVMAQLERFRQVDWNRRAVGENKDLSDDAWKTRIDVENRLIALGKPAVPTLIQACSDADQHVRTLAAYCLGFLNDRSAVSALKRISGSDSYAPARLMAVEALGRLGARNAIKVVEAAAKSDPSPHVRAAAEWALPRVRKGYGVGNSLREMAMRLYDHKLVASAVVGQPAPDFALPNHVGEVVHLSDFRAKKNVVIVFMLADW
ncbi:MAG: HEAT repeat domain-containing protein [Armatimonadetes bacterium]|nr:HEAT repeat domain-containing protein [Armatimonadota bacterium]